MARPRRPAAKVSSPWNLGMAALHPTRRERAPVSGVAAALLGDYREAGGRVGGAHCRANAVPRVSVSSCIFLRSEHKTNASSPTARALRGHGVSGHGEARSLAGGGAPAHARTIGVTAL